MVWVGLAVVDVDRAISGSNEALMISWANLGAKDDERMVGMKLQSKCSGCTCEYMGGMV